MKEIIAIIRMNKMNETKRALADVGIYSFTARKVTGRGRLAHARSHGADFCHCQNPQELLKVKHWLIQHHTLRFAQHRSPRPAG